MVGSAPNAKAPVRTQSSSVPNSSSQTLTSRASAADDPAEIERLAPYVDSLEGMLDVTQVKKTRLIDVRATHTDPAVATKVGNATADAFALWNLEVKTKTNSLAGTYLDKPNAQPQSQNCSRQEPLID